MMTVEQLSEKLQLSPYTIYNMVRKRQIPYIKLGYRILRFDPIEVEKYIHKHTVKPKK